MFPFNASFTSSLVALTHVPPAYSNPTPQIVSTEATRADLRSSSSSSQHASKPHSSQRSPPSPVLYLAYPERLLIYHAGTSRAVFIGCLKVTTIFLFAFFVLFVFPNYLFSPEEPYWVAIAALLAGSIPLLFIRHTTAPFVVFIHIRVPPYAHRSKDLLMRFARTLPPSTELDLTTMRFGGRPRVTRLPVSELRTTNRRFGLVNLVRLPPAPRQPGLSSPLADAPVKRPWWRLWRRKGVREFYVGEGSGRGRVRASEVWQEVLRAIGKAGAKEKEKGLR